MEADWSVEIGPDEPCIDSSWDGFVDLRSSQQAIDRVKEAEHHPALREALLALNGTASPLFTSKCDTWVLGKKDIDPDEFSANSDDSEAGFASYIDILERDAARFASFAFHERRVRELVSDLRAIDLHHGRIDIVLRAAASNEQSGYGLTLYAAGCGASATDAYTAWQAVLTAAVAATITSAAFPQRAGE